jgi:hypothetical protein
VEEKMRRNINSKTCLIVWLILLTLQAAAATAAKIIYVDDDANGLNDGSSWLNAYKFLQDALMMARDGDELRVAQGVYKPDEFVLSDRPNLGRAETFQLKNGVVIRGGYAGLGQPDPNARNFELYKTILSGDLYGDDDENFINNRENGYHVVTSNYTDATVVLDGFIIIGGNAGVYPGDTAGAGMYNKSGNPTVKNCIFTNNRAGYGGGMCNDANSCPMIINCIFIGNASDFGGGICNQGNSCPLLYNCTFYQNSAYHSGGGMYNEHSSPLLTNCAFEQNLTPGAGAGMCNVWSSPILTECAFVENNANLSIYQTGSGGGMSNFGSKPTLNRCTFTRNSAVRGGGITNDGDSNPVIINCDFEGNSSYYSGGGVYNSSGNNPFSPIFIQCTFRGNRAGKGNRTGKGGVGGGMFNGYFSAPQVNNCTFSENSAKQGGAMCNISFVTTALDNCIFIGNSASADGGGLYTCGGTTSLINCTFAGNLAANGNSIACGYAPYIPPGPPPRKLYCSPSTIEATNCIFWEQIECIGQHYGSIINIRYSTIQGEWPGEGNINADPCFAEPGYWDPNGTPADVNDDFWVNGDYHLKSQAGRWDANEGRWTKDEVTSLCIDAGDPASPIGLEPFPNGGVINMGAYGGTIEASKSYFGEPVCETIVAGDINGDCVVNFKDFALMAFHWLEEH